MKPDATVQINEEPPINKAIGDIVAIAGGDPEFEATVLVAAMVLCCEHLARAVGRSECRNRLQMLDRQMRDAQPVRPWRD
jgi:hypothetical protein